MTTHTPARDTASLHDLFVDLILSGEVLCESMAETLAVRDAWDARVERQRVAYWEGKS